MTSIQEKISALKASVQTAKEDLTAALAFYEAWKPVASDEQLLAKLKQSPVATTILTIRLALKREMLLALDRLWQNMERASRSIKSRDVLSALTKERSSKPAMQAVVRRQLAQHLAASTAMLDNYASDYAKATLDRWLTASSLRTSDLAADMEASEIGKLVADLRELTSRLSSLALGECDDFLDVAQQYSDMSLQFWRSVGYAK